MKIRMQPWRPLPALGAAFLFLSALLNVVYPGGLSWRFLVPSMDVWLLRVSMALAAWCGKRPLFWTGLTAAVLFLTLRLFRTGDTAASNRDSNLQSHLDRSHNMGIYPVFPSR